MKTVSIVFPHQLFLEHPAIDAAESIYIVEEALFFTQYNFHKAKLCLHRASMKYYAQKLENAGKNVVYIEAADPRHDVRILLPLLADSGIQNLHVCLPDDYLLERRINRTVLRHGLEIEYHASPYFINGPADKVDFFKNKKKYFQTAYYKEERKRLKILIDPAGEPVGGKWSFDEENREKFPASKTPPVLKKLKENEFVTEAKLYVAKHFKDNYGELKDFNYPVTHEEAEVWLLVFFKERFNEFGIYEDAIVKENHTLNHALLTPMLNVGLLEPKQIINAALKAAKTYNIPINSLEGFLRQVLSWREFVHQVYVHAHVAQRTTNYWGFTRKIPASFWDGTTGIEPVDTTIQELLRTGYCHHIERLMILGNFMVLCEFDPDEVYKWFMELFIDSYDWVMVPNVYGMSQFADGGLMTTKPYISGSNYILKMSNYKKGKWCETWDALFWRFMNVHVSFFKANPRLSLLTKSMEKMVPEKLQNHLTVAENFLHSLDKAT